MRTSPPPVAPPVVLSHDNLIAVLRDRLQRNLLLKAMAREQGTDLPLSNRYMDLARTCTATHEQLHELVKEMLRFRGRYRRLLCALVFHPNMAEKTLLLLLAKRCCITELGHRPGPRILLERVVARYRYSEAITTLALYHYGTSDYPTEAFAAFLEEHMGDSMLRSNITRATALPLDKQEAVRRVFGTPAAPGHA